MTDLDRLEELLAKAPDINHARITLKREIEVILPKAVVDDALKAITELRQLREIVREAEKTVLDLIHLAEVYEVQIDGEWGSCRDLDMIEEDGNLPKQITAARALHNKIKEVMG